MGALAAAVAVMLRVGTGVAEGAAVASEPPTVAIEHVTVLPMDSERVLADQTAVVANGRISALGDASAVAIPGEAMRVDGRGLTVLPGLADMHVHARTEPQLRTYLAYGVTVIRSMWGEPAQLELRGKLERGEVVGARLYVASPILDGDPPIWPGSSVVTTPEQARAVVDELAAAGYDWLKVYNRLSKEAFLALAAAGRDRGLALVGHVPEAVTLEEALDAGMRTIEHFTGFRSALQAEDSPLRKLSREDIAKLPRPELMAMAERGLDRGRIDEVARLNCAHGTWNTPTLLVQERIWAEPEEKAAWLASHSQMRFVEAETRAFWDPANDFRLRNVPPEARKAIRAGLALERDLVLALDRNGCGLLLGTDAGNPFVFDGWSVHEELELFVKAGLSPYAALRAATASPARFVGAEDRFGRVAPGLEADLLVVRGNPLDVITRTRDVVAVFSRGRYYDRAALDGMLDEVAKAMTAP
jgi:imidazolonepropionase-like amidohydrolase